MTLAKELGDELKTRVHVDAAAAKGIVERSGLDKVRHIDVGVLWLQEQAARERVPLHKIDGAQTTSGDYDSSSGKEEQRQLLSYTQ